MRKSSHIILLNKSGEILLQLRDNKPEIFNPGYWGLIGGAIDHEENPLDALLREINEEIPGCDITNIIKLGDISSDNYLMNIFFGKTNDSEELLNKRLNEGVKVQFFNFSEIKNLKMANNIKEFIFKNRQLLF